MHLRMYKPVLELNNLQGLICYKTKPSKSFDFLHTHTHTHTIIKLKIMAKSLLCYMRENAKQYHDVFQV